MDEITPKDVDLDLAKDLGATLSSTQCFSVYIPNKDSKGKEIGNQRQWVLEAIRMLSQINGGATAMPPVEGGWLSDDREIIWESPVVVYSFIRTAAFTGNLIRIREFLHRMGRATDQGKIAFEFGSMFFSIRTFDPA